MMYVCLRDDDTNFYTKFSELEDSYKGILHKYPITLGVIPFVHGSTFKMLQYDPLNEKKLTNIDEVQIGKKNQFTKLRDWEIDASSEQLSYYHQVHPVGLNKNLTDNLKILIDQDLIEIAQHGVFHRFTSNGREMEADRIAFELIKEGKEYLEKVFNVNISTFIPPSNTIDYICADFVKKLRMNLFSSGNIKFKNKLHYFYRSLKSPLFLAKKIFKKISRRSSPLLIESNFERFASITFDPYKTKNQVLTEMRKQLNKKGFASLGTHYHVLLSNEKYRTDYLSIIKELENMNVKFVTAKKYYRLLKGGQYE